MSRLIFVLLFCFVFLFYCSSCEKEIELDFPEEGKLVLLSNFSPDSLFKVSLSTTIPINNTIGQVASYPANASIQLFENGVHVDDFIYRPAVGLLLPAYVLNTKPTESNIYKVMASLPGYPTVEASNHIPSKVAIAQLSLSNLYVEEVQDITGRFRYELDAKIKIVTGLETKQYFHMKAWQRVIKFNVLNGDTILSESLHEVDISLIDNSNTDLQIEHERGVLLEQSSFIAQPDGLGLRIRFLVDKNTQLEGPILIELRHVSKDYYLFHKSVGEQELSSNNQNVLSTEAYFIYNNIVGGIGNFSGYQVSIDSISY